MLNEANSAMGFSQYLIGLAGAAISPVALPAIVFADFHVHVCHLRILDDSDHHAADFYSVGGLNGGASPFGHWSPHIRSCLWKHVLLLFRRCLYHICRHRGVEYTPDSSIGPIYLNGGGHYDTALFTDRVAVLLDFGDASFRHEPIDMGIGVC